MKKYSIIDSHVHLWNPDILNYPWLEGNSLLNRPYLLEDYINACGKINVEKIVFVQAECDPSQYLKEVQFVTNLAHHNSKISAIVSWAPLEKGEEVKAELDKLFQNKLVKGIRRIIQYEKDPEFCLQYNFVKGAQCLYAYDFSFDLCVSNLQLGNAVKLVEQCTHIQFILDHIGKPDIKNNLFEPWKTEIRKLSQMPNVYCKISGLVTEADHKTWEKEDLLPYIYHILECFGFDRVLYGGDWPVVLLASDYNRWFNTLVDIVNMFSEDEIHKLFYDNAAKFYKLF